MTNIQVTVGIALILLVFLSGGLAVVVVSNQKNVNDAKTLGQASLDYFKKVGKKCDAHAGDFSKVTTCMQDLKQQLGVIGDLKEQSFMDFSAKRNDTGFLVLESSIDPGYLCRLEFTTPCEKGDVLEVMYDEKRAFLKTC